MFIAMPFRIEVHSENQFKLLTPPPLHVQVNTSFSEAYVFFSRKNIYITFQAMIMDMQVLLISIQVQENFLISSSSPGEISVVEVGSLFLWN